MQVQIHISDELMQMKDEGAKRRALENELKNVMQTIMETRQEANR